MKRKTLYRLTALLLTLVLLGCGGFLLWKNLDYGKGEQDYQIALKTAGIPQWLQPDERPAPEPSEHSNPEPTPTAAPQETSAQVDPYAAALANADLTALREVNDDVTAWISIPGTRLSYPVLQGDDNRYYLNHTWLKQRSSVGSIFMECQCDPDFSDFNTIVYGHRMNNNSMFGILKRYQNLDYCQSHPSIYITTDSGVLIYDVFAAYEVGVSEIVYRLNLEDYGLEQSFIDFCLEHSQVNPGIVPTPEDQVLTLSTCTGQGHETRWVVQAVLRSDEDTVDPPSAGDEPEQETPPPAETTPVQETPPPAESTPPQETPPPAESTPGQETPPIEGEPTQSLR